MTTPAVLKRLEAQLGELVDARTRCVKDRRDFTKYADDPVGFIRDILKGKPWAKQRAIARLVRDHPLVAIQSANGVGKDYIAAAIALWWVFARRGLVLITGPTDRQVKEIIMRTEIAQHRRRGKLQSHCELLTNALRLPEDADVGRVGILAQTSSTDDGASKLTGHHAPRILVILTEAQGVEPFAWDALLACAVGAEDRVLAIGNPMSPIGTFFTITRPNSPWRTLAISAFEHPNLKQKRTVIPGGPSREGIRRIRQHHGGTGSREYTSRVLGQFPESSEDALVTRAWLDAAVRRYERGTFSKQAQGSDWRAGVDVARSLGGDQSALALVRGPVLHSVKTWRSDDTMAIANKVQAKLRAKHLAPREYEVPNPFVASQTPQYGPGISSPAVTIIVDVTGVGAGVADKLTEQGWSVVEHESSGGARNRRDNHNRRAECYWRLRTLLEEGKIALPRDERLFEELLMTRVLYLPNGKRKIEPKLELRLRLGRSPDRADAVSMAFGSNDEASGGGDMIDL